jgi:cell division protein FtsB
MRRGYPDGDATGISWRGYPGGDAKQFKSEALDMRWYPESQSITLNGRLKDELRTKLAAISENINQNAILKNTIEVIKAEIEALKSQLTSYQDATNSAILDLTVSSTKLTNNEKTSKLEKLRQENQKLKDENNALAERVNNLIYYLI